MAKWCARRKARSFSYAAPDCGWLPRKRMRAQRVSGSSCVSPSKRSSRSSSKNAQSYRENCPASKCSFEMPTPTFPRKTTASRCDCSSLRMEGSMSRKLFKYSASSIHTMRQAGVWMSSISSRRALFASCSCERRWSIFRSMRDSSASFCSTTAFCCRSLHSIVSTSRFCKKSAISGSGMSSARR